MVRCIPGAARPAAGGIGAFGEIALDDLAQKVTGFVFFGCGWGGRLSHPVILGGGEVVVDWGNNGMYHAMYHLCRGFS
jgi:hypothetical protein